MNAVHLNRGDTENESGFKMDGFPGHLSLELFIAATTVPNMLVNYSIDKFPVPPSPGGDSPSLLFEQLLSHIPIDLNRSKV